MSTQKRFMGTLAALALIAAFFLSACGDVGSENGYTFRFKVDNESAKDIKEVAFINGDRRNDTTLNRWSYRIGVGDRSAEYRQSGFTVEHESATRLFGVKITFEDGESLFDWSYAGHENKVLITAVKTPSWKAPKCISFSDGHW